MAERKVKQLMEFPGYKSSGVFAFVEVTFEEGVLSDVKIKALITRYFYRLNDDLGEALSKDKKAFFFWSDTYVIKKEYTVRRGVEFREGSILAKTMSNDVIRTAFRNGILTFDPVDNVFRISPNIHRGHLLRIGYDRCHLYENPYVEYLRPVRGNKPLNRRSCESSVPASRW